MVYYSWQITLSRDRSARRCQKTPAASGKQNIRTGCVSGRVDGGDFAEMSSEVWCRVRNGRHRNVLNNKINGDLYPCFIIHWSKVRVLHGPPEKGDAAPPGDRVASSLSAGAVRRSNAVPAPRAEVGTVVLIGCCGERIPQQLRFVSPRPRAQRPRSTGRDYRRSRFGPAAPDSHTPPGGAARGAHAGPGSCPRPPAGPGPC